jgi:hypothetical protein
VKRVRSTGSARRSPIGRPGRVDLLVVQPSRPANDPSQGAAATGRRWTSRARRATYVCVGPPERAAEIREKLAGILVTLFRQSLVRPANTNGQLGGGSARRK